ncbi:hypothetical protein AYM40_35345 [Paraburkholderia phytofirmans OLGA172]|uniref:Uncharacterized protein n=1 Tax=Paraburkholderia phytofirmans OLGA172 TaxID=1417228 RepID=A0A161I8E5_9BURK|nr:hypothetical protein [Paraburkholderia phytofirmans]ANB77353.1 hypothetical protein AYM40_35345 [Paraburkholderia phytofirmans OLGA172]
MFIMKAQVTGAGIGEAWKWTATAYRQEMNAHSDVLGEPSVLLGECFAETSGAGDGTLLREVIASMLKRLEAPNDGGATTPQERRAPMTAMTIVIRVGRRARPTEAITIMRFDVVLKDGLVYTSVMREDAPRMDIEPISCGRDAHIWSIFREVLLRL